MLVEEVAVVEEEEEEVEDHHLRDKETYTNSIGNLSTFVRSFVQFMPKSGIH